MNKRVRFTMDSRLLRWVLPALLMLATSQSLQAQDILHYLPEDALGFVLVRDLAEASEKCDHLIKMFELPIPAPLTLLKIATGLGDGVDLHGDVLISLIPGSQTAADHEPLLLLPITDYGKFAASIRADESGEVSRAAIAREDVLVARHGPYAMIMNVENRETLEILVGLEPQPVKMIEPLASWMHDNVATIGVMPTGLKKLLELSQNLADLRQANDEELVNLDVSTTLLQMQQGLVAYQMLHDLFGMKFDLIAGGISIDEQSNLRFGLRLLAEGDLPASTTTIPTNRPDPLAGYPDQPFVLAGGGPLDGAWTIALTKASVQMMRESSELYGFEDLEDKQWEELEANYQELVEGLHSISLIMLPGKKGEPLFSNFFGTAKVADAAEYLQSYRKSIEDWNLLMAQSTSDIQLQYEIRDTEIGGAEACEVVVDVAAAAQDPNVPMFNWMLEAMFGKDGKLHTLFVVADEKTLVYGMADEQLMTQVADEVKQQENGLQNSAHLQTTNKLLNPTAAWKFYVSPQGCVTWAKRIMDELLGQIQQPPEIPEYEAGPPVGISLHLGQRQAEVDVVWPVEGLRGLADYVEKCRAL